MTPFSAISPFRAALVVLLWGASSIVAQEALPPQARERMQRQIAALAAEKAARTPRQQKIDSHLLYAARQATGGLVDNAMPGLRVSVELASDGRTEVDIKGAITPAVLDAIAAAGGTVTNSHPELDAVRALLPLAGIEEVADLPDVRAIHPAERGEPNAGSVDSEGDTTHQAIQARQMYGATGAGVTVGVMSDSIDNSKGALAAAYASGDLDPANTFVISGQAGTGAGEGLAMLEIVHDIAPAAKLYYATCNPSPEQMAANIRALAAAGCQIIVDDYTYDVESPFQDGVIARAVNEVTAQGVYFFSCARNSGNFDQGAPSVWEGDYADGGDASNFTGKAGARFHSFKYPDQTGTIYNQISQRAYGSITLFWSDPLGASANDYDLYQVDALGDIEDYSNNTQSGSQDPYENIPIAKGGDYVVVVKASGAARFLHVEVGRQILEVSTAGAVRGHNASTAANAFCVAATPAHNARSANQAMGPFPGPFNSSNQTESFSSDGPRRMFFSPTGAPLTPGNFLASGGQLFAKPDFTAADGVVTTLPANAGLNPFFGTSASSPHAAAIGALLLSANPSITAAQFRAALVNGAVQIDGHGVGNRNSGAGILLASSVLQSVQGAPSIGGFSPANGPAGTNVTVSGLNLVGTQSASIHGTPAAFSSATAGSIIVTVPAGATTGVISLTTSGGTATSATVFTVTPAVTTPVINSPGAASGQVGAPFTYRVTATNNPSQFDASDLPPGLSIDGAAGLISGAPSAAGTYAVLLSARNATGGASTAPLTLTILPAIPAITSAPTATGVLGAAFSFQVSASNAPASFAADGLPAGLILDPATGLIGGTPAAEGTFPAAVSATNAGGTGRAGLTLTITRPAPAITSPASATGQVGVAFAYGILASDAASSFGANGLPPGLTVNPVTGQIAGVPSAAGTFTVTLSASNGTVGSATLALTILPPPPLLTAPPGGEVIVGEFFRYQIVTDGASRVDAYSAAGLPPGLNVDPASGLISGTLAEGSAPGAFDVTLGATGGGSLGTAVRTFTAVAAPVGKVPDVVAALSGGKASLSGGKLKFKGTYTLNNVGAKAAKNVIVAAYLATSPTFSFPLTSNAAGAGLMPLGITLAPAVNPALPGKIISSTGGELTVIASRKLAKANKPGSSFVTTFKIKAPAELLQGLGSHYRYLLLVADPLGNVSETGKANNVVALDLSAVQP